MGLSVAVIISGKKAKDIGQIHIIPLKEGD
jgi:hypothetical protein